MQKISYAILVGYLFTLATFESIASEKDTPKSTHLTEIVREFKKSVSNSMESDFRLMKSLNFDSENSKAVNKQIGTPSTYPQGFYINEEKDLIFILRYSNKHPSRAVIEEYKWSSSELINTYIIPEPQNSVSEALIVDHVGDKNIAYIRSENKLARYELIKSPSQIGSALKIGSLYDNVAQSFSRLDNLWYVEKYKTHKDSLGQSRGEYAILNSDFKHIGDITFPVEYSGYRESQKLNIPKHQGFAAIKDGFVMSMGGHWSDTSKATPYHYYGINYFDKSGNIKSSNYVAPEILFDKLREWGIDADVTENEGIQGLNDGSLVVLQVVQTKGKPGGKILFISFKI
ncbi:hypothetical protein SJI00_01455 [Pseudomonas sp. RP23018S]|uniref:hypothetical protein n=1 Tax=Pseudomonas sp. RP23018S TaxID=3096037 RepID=UPI002ACAD492|nr:hypothetical protein [Pseudomonas sp. RP23018S]MDZ5601451.1 hypothetical protein [Pseudomonas sp. RP23018S]